MKVLLLAGEESGLIYAERLREVLRAERPDAVFRGYQSEGFKTADLAVMGFGAVLRRLPYFLGVARTMKRVIRTWRPDVVVTVDYPGLNLKLAAYAKALGIPAVHLVCPQVWAWHRGRIPRVAASLTKLLCFFPFEPALFAAHEGPSFTARFIGHPLVDVFAEETSQRKTSAPCMALLPGSRLGEIQRILPRLLAALPLIRPPADGKGPLAVTIPAANPRAEAEIRRFLAAAVVPDGMTVNVVQGGARDVLRTADCAAVASGTATLEAALARCPTVLVYAVSPWLAWFARRVIKGVRHIGLANVIAEKAGLEPPMPELLQEAFTPEAVADRLSRWLNDTAQRQRAVEALETVMARLHADGDALGRAAREICSTVRA